MEMKPCDAVMLLNTKSFTPIVFGFPFVPYLHSQLSTTLAPSALSGDEKPSETKVEIASQDESWRCAGEEAGRQQADWLGSLTQPIL